MLARDGVAAFKSYGTIGAVLSLIESERASGKANDMTLEHVDAVIVDGNGIPHFVALSANGDNS